jgi:hypothetical protein
MFRSLIYESAPSLLNTNLTDNYPDIDVFPTAQTYFNLVEGKNKYLVKRLNSIGEIDAINILSYPMAPNWPIFTYIFGFTPILWLLLLLSLVIISIIISIDNKKTYFFAQLWRYSSLLLSEAFPKIAIKQSLTSLPQKLILIVWLLSCTIMLSAFSGVLLGFFYQKSITYCY